MPFLFAIVGFILGAGLLYWLQQKELAKVQQRLKRVQRDLEQTQKTLAQAEVLSKQQATQLKRVQEAKAQTKEPELYYQAQLQEREVQYQAQSQERELYYQGQLRELEQSYQTRLQEVEQSYQARLQELEQSLKTSQPPTPPEAVWEKPEADLEEISEDEPESYLSNPFVSHELEKPQESEAPLPDELDLAQFLEAEKDDGLAVSLQPESPAPLEELPPESELDLFEILSSDTEKVAHLPEIPHDDGEDDNSLSDLFSDQESSSNELEELLKLHEVKADSTPGTGDQ